MKRTTKYVAALKCARSILDKATLRSVQNTNEPLYDALEKAAYFWNAVSGEWRLGRLPTSMFEGEAGDPTGEIRLRLMAHPGDMDQLLEIVNESMDTYGATVIETSNRYPNRRGPGQRIYMTVRLPHKKE